MMSLLLIAGWVGVPVPGNETNHFCVPSLLMAMSVFLSVPTYATPSAPIIGPRIAGPLTLARHFSLSVYGPATVEAAVRAPFCLNCGQGAPPCGEPLARAMCPGSPAASAATSAA